MGRHRSGQPARRVGVPAGSPNATRRDRTALWVGLAVLAVVAIASTAVALVTDGPGEDSPPAAGSPCPRSLRVVTASSFSPVLNELEAGLERGPDCVALDTVVVDGRAAAGRVAERQADVWIPDDASWAGVAAPDLLAEEGTLSAGTVLATSPIYMVADGPTAAKVKAAGASWRGLAGLLARRSGVRLAVRDPNSSGDGMVAAGALAEAVWLDKGMDASSAALSTALQVTRTVAGDAPALPERAGEVGLVPEYALLPALDRLDDATVLPGADHTAVLRFAWLPTAAAAGTPERAAALERLLSVLKSPAAASAVAAARLRRADGDPPPDAPRGRLPELGAEPLGVLGPHHVDHVFAAWYVQDRRGSILLVVDVSGSMREPAPGTTTPLIEYVKRGCLAVGRLLPDEASVGLWAFGSRLDPPRDHEVLLPTRPLGEGQRVGLGAAVGRLAARTTGTGLYDTILAAYSSATRSYRPGVGNQVVVFTDGRNEDDPGSISAGQLKARLQAVADPERRVEITVVAFGSRPEVEVLADVLEPVRGYVSDVRTPQQVQAAFLHAAASGVHG
jgi:hypothetical protein